MQDRAGTRPDAVASGLAKGALAGAAATIIMEAVDTVIHRLEPEESRRLTRAVRPNGKDPVHNLASEVSSALGRGPIPQGHPGGRFAYYAVGIAAGALYGALRGRVPGLDAGRGLGFGAGRFVVEDKIYTPLAGTAAAPHRYPWQAHARQFAALAVHGIATDLMLRAMDGLGDGRLRERAGEETREPGPGLRARLVTALLPLTGMKRAFRDEETLRRDVARRRRKEPALPSDGMRRRLRVTETRDRGSLVVQVEPRDGPSGDTILYIHGGAYVRDVQSAQWSFVERLVHRTGARVVAPLYPVAPEHTWRDAFALVAPLYERLVAQVGPERLTVLGDSAGGGMTLALMQQMRDRGCPLPARLVLLAPWLDVTLSDPSQAGIAGRDPMLDIPGLVAAGRWYAGDLDPRDPRISPINGSMRDLPPIALFTGTRDLVHPDSRRLRDKAAREGVRLDYHEYPDLFHVWPEVDIPEGNRAIAQMAAFIGVGERAEARPG